MHAQDPERLVEAFYDRTLPEPEWTHEAHLTVCWYTLADLSASAAIPHLRRAIRSYNEATGVPNTDSSGYHETLTRYYVQAVDSIRATSLQLVLAAPECSRTAPLRHWSRALLFSAPARRGWIAPDLAPLPWPAPDPPVER